MGDTYAVATSAAVTTQAVHCGRYFPVSRHAVTAPLCTTRVEVDHVIGIRSTTDGGIATHRTLNVLPVTNRGEAKSLVNNVYFSYLLSKRSPIESIVGAISLQMSFCQNLLKSSKPVM